MTYSPPSASTTSCPRRRRSWLGVRAADSPIRRMSIKKTGPVNVRRAQAFPVYDWRAEHLRQAIVEAKCRLPVDYQLFGRSFDGIDARFLLPVREHYPDDYAVICDWFPLAPAIVRRHELYWPEATEQILAASRLHVASAPLADLTPTRTHDRS